MSRHGSESKKQRKYKEAKMLRNFTGSTGIRAAIAVLMLLFVVACSGSDSGIKRERDEARAATEAAEQATMAAEAAAKKAAEDAAAQAEATRLAAEEAAAQAERDKQAAIEQARQEVIAQQERQSVMTAIAAAQAAVGALMDDSSDVDVAAASGAVASASAAIAAATTFSADDTAMYTSQVTMVATTLATTQANIRAYRAEMAAQEAMNQATASARAKQAVDEAIAALTAADQAEAMSTAAYTAAAAALSAAQTAVANADADTLAEAGAALAVALTDAATAAADLGVKTQAVTDATAALEAARATLASVDPTHVALQAATAALERAQTEANNQAEAIKALQKQIADLQKAEQDRMDAAERMAEEERMKAMATKGKALEKALGDNPLGNLRMDTDTPLATLGSSGLTLGVPTADSATDAEDGQPMKAVEGSAGTLGDWKSMKYAHTDTGTKVTNEAMVYTKRGAGTQKEITQANIGVVGDTGLTLGTGTGVAGRTISIADDTESTDFKGTGFPTAGTKTFTPDVAGRVLVQGYLRGAKGVYVCATAPCNVDGDGAKITLGSSWTFIHDVGAKLSSPDNTYLYFGWWLQQNADGPTKASAFFGNTGVAAITVEADDPATLGGSATYAGKAAGKFAINDPLRGGDAGHFTADATLTAKFAANASNGGVTGTINNFMANDEAVPWSVKLNRSGWDAGTDGDATDPFGQFGMTADDPSTTDIDESTMGKTVWSIDGNAAPASGGWNGQMYDEKPGNTPSGDGSNVPTTVIGRFQSMFGSTHTMVGAFGAEKKQ